MTTLETNPSAEPDNPPSIMALGLAMAALGSLAYLLLVWAAVQFGMI